MTRNTELHFGSVPRIHGQRSKFDLSHSHKTTFNTGEVIPIYVDTDIMPGDGVELNMAEIIRMATPIYPVCDNMVYDIYAFFVPHRLTWDHLEEFFGENEDEWARAVEYEVPVIEAPSGGWAEGTIADYMGIPTYVDGIEVNAFGFRSYAKIMSDWFRDQNTMKACHIYRDETTRTGSNGTDYVTDPELGGMPYKACKLHDYFTSALPGPQKSNNPVSIPLGTSAPLGIRSTATNWFRSHPDQVPVNLVNPTAIAANNRGTVQIQNESPGGATLPADNYLKLDLTNMYADLNNATSATINQLRTAFAIQKYYEGCARFGTRYIEYLKGVFGVESSDARLQRSEYLGGMRFSINMDQILQTSSTDATSPQGNASGFSCTNQQGKIFHKAFEEHGTLMILGVARVIHSYQQGLDRMWSRKKWFDYANPFFVNLGEQDIELREIYATGTSADDTVFGYQERFAEYRYKQNRISGHMRSNSPTGSLDAWVYTDDYNAPPTLTKDWIVEPKDNVDRTLAVSSALAHQFIADFYLQMYYTRRLPVYGVPGLIDHV